MTTKKKAPKPRPKKCRHNDEYVEAYFATDPNPVVVMRCANCSMPRTFIGEYPNIEYD